MEETLRPFVTNDSITEARNNLFVEVLYKFTSTLTAFDLLTKQEGYSHLKAWHLLTQATQLINTAFDMAKTMARRTKRGVPEDVKRSIVEFRQWLQLEQWSVGSFELIASNWELIGAHAKAQELRQYYANLYMELSVPYVDDEIAADTDRMSPLIVRTHFNALRQTYGVFTRRPRAAVFNNLCNQARAFLQIIIADRSLLVEYSCGEQRNHIENILQCILENDQFLQDREEFETFVSEHVRTKLNIGGSYATAFAERVEKSIKLFEQFEHASIIEKYLDRLQQLKCGIQRLIRTAKRRIAKVVSMWDCLKAFGIFLATPFIALADCFMDHSFTNTKNCLEFACKTVSENPKMFAIVATCLIGSAVLIGLSAGAGLAVIPAVAACAGHAAGAVSLITIGCGASAYAGWCLRDCMIEKERARLYDVQMQSENLLAIRAAEEITRSKTTTRQQAEDMEEIADHLRDKMAELKSRRRQRQERQPRSAIPPAPLRERARLRMEEQQREMAKRFIRDTVGELAREDCEETIEQLQIRIEELETLRCTAEQSLDYAKDAVRASVVGLNTIENLVNNLFHAE